MGKPARRSLILLTALLALGIAAYTGLFYWDNKYTAALPGGYGYSVLTQAEDAVGFLVDGWEYYPGQLLGPEDFTTGTEPEAYTYIGQYPNFSTQLGTPYGVATYRLRLESDTPRQLALYVPELLCAGRIYIGGVLVGEQGSLEPYEPRVMDGVYAFAVTGSVEVIIQCANYTHYYSGLYYPPGVGTTAAVTALISRRLTVYSALSLIPLAVAALFLGQWAWSRENQVRWTGLICLFVGLRQSYPLLRAMGVSLVRPVYALEDISAALLLLFAMVLAGELSGAVSRWYHRRLAVPAAVAMGVACAVFPLLILPYAPSFINSYGLILFFWKFLAGGYLLFLAARARRTQSPLGDYLLAAAGVYGLSMVAAALLINRFEPAVGAWPEEYGGFLLAMGFAALQVHRGVLLHRENRRLTLHLHDEVAHRTRAVETLLAERRELLANLIHDLKNPLTAVRTYAELVEQDGLALDEETAAHLRALRERVSAMGERLELLQDFSRAERDAPRLAPLELCGLLERFHQVNQPDLELAGQNFYLRLPDAPVYVRGDPQRLWAALENLCYNALSFTPEDGTITLELERKEDQAVIWVRDTGCGIQPEDLPHVFERGFTSRKEQGGDGLGLYIVRLIAVEHAGTVGVNSEPGQGSDFYLRLPLAEPPR